MRREIEPTTDPVKVDCMAGWGCGSVAGVVEEGWGTTEGSGTERDSSLRWFTEGRVGIEGKEVFLGEPDFGKIMKSG